MVDSSISGIFGEIKNAASSGSSGGSVAGASSGLWWIAGFLIGLGIFVLVGVGVWWWYSEKKRWNMVTRVHAENPSINGVSICNDSVLTRRVRFKDGRVVFLYKTPIQGYGICPELMVYTRPREYDVIVTQDKKLFCLKGIEGVDMKRKILKVEVNYPDIEMDRQDLQNHIDSKKYDDPNERFKMMLKTGMWIFVLIAVIVGMIMFGKYYVEGKEVDLKSDQMSLETAELQLQTIEAMNTFLRITGYDMNRTGEVVR